MYVTGLVLAASMWAGGEPPARLELRELEYKAPRRPGLVLYGTVAAADLASTEWGLSRGWSEGNGLGQRRAVRFAAKAAVVAGLVALDRSLDKPRDKGKRRFLRAAVVAIWGGAATYNAIRVARDR